MKLVIGGYAQGKLEYALSKYHISADLVWDSVIPDETTLCQECGINRVIINHFHDWVKRRILDGKNPEEEFFSFLENSQNLCEDIIIISDEIGNGIVPAVAFEREYRERLGRLLIRLADRAEEVVRVICGIGQKIK